MRPWPNRLQSANCGRSRTTSSGGPTIPSLPLTLGLQVAMRLTGPTTRPEFHLADAGHPIYREQTVGITAHRIHEYNAFFA